jgi:hypothetical protein
MGARAKAIQGMKAFFAFAYRQFIHNDHPSLSAIARSALMYNITKVGGWEFYDN